ncbi:hypothetical protein AVEN_214688-1 [Araneus ventricosus]|uniref:Histone-lysine N-methyltransferase SETMAR n=1 Tax=Araneus ventricosus TaxID=182803 RepID=A0A4Y2W745_ARAVE|nr:hypothetical protein AVEN_125761-1 [Araneus ventricosus]GBO32355.1 hypothetical protein AVEN_214688-1 [Araneus ventricosus]
MAHGIDAPAKCELRSVIRFLQAEGWFTENDQCSCFLRLLRRAILIFKVVLIHDSARRHSTFVIQQLLEQFNWDVSYHPAYSPDLATSDFHLFPELNNWQGGQSFQKNEEIQSKFKAYLTLLVGTFFEKGIGNLVHRYENCLNLHGDYVEK